MRRFRGEIIKDAYSVTKVRYIVVRYTEIPIYQISRTVKELTYKFTPIAQFKKVYFSNDPMFRVILNRYEQDLPIIIHGELAQIQLDFSYVLKARNPVTHKVENLKCMKYDANRNIHIKGDAISNAIKVFIEEQRYWKKSELINKEINRRKKDAYECD